MSAPEDKPAAPPRVETSAVPKEAPGLANADAVARAIRERSPNLSVSVEGGRFVTVVYTYTAIIDADQDPGVNALFADQQCAVARKLSEAAR